ncbi:MAG: MATE family efflux transporter [Erysipelotrichaceae bacterium]|nr:MATE family efflux transporter [Erysipelotrichaceae bacterium]
MDENRYLGEEKISKLLFKFSVPCVAGLLISAFYNIVDQIFIGNSSLGYLGNAATGVSFPVICIANAFAWCIGDGAASFLSICSGRNDNESAHKCVGTGITVTTILSILLSLVCLVFIEPLMSMFGASSQTLEMSINYFRIVSNFFPVYLLMNVLNSMIRADGSPSYAMKGMLIGAITNIILDPIFIYVLDWGIEGAAWATVIGQTLSFLFCAIYFRKPKTFKLTLPSFKPDVDIMRTTVSLGASTFVTQISIVLVSLTCNIMLAKYGALSIYGPDIPISVFSIQTKVYTIVLSVVTGIVLGGQPIFGYNYGARKLDRVKELYMTVLKLTIITGVVATVFCQFFPKQILSIFGIGSELYLEFGIKTFRIYLSLMTITGLVKMTAVFFQSIGKSVFAVAASLIRDIVCFCVLALTLPAILENQMAGTGINGILIAAPIADVVALIVVLVLTVSFFKPLKNTETEVVEEAQLQDSKEGIIITIGREHGTGGKQIGKLVADMLNVPFYYKEMTVLAAQQSGLDKEFLSGLNENSPNILHDLYLSTNVVQQAVIAQEKVIRSIADKGACVIVGRAADYILKDRENVFNVFIHAPKDFRVKNIMEMYGDTEVEAEENVRHSDAARASYYRNVTSQKWGDPHHMDLCIDASLGREVCAKIICDAALAAYKKVD